MLRILVSTLMLFVIACGGGGSDSGGGGSACSAFRVLNGSECRSEDIPVVQIGIRKRNGIGTCTGTLVRDDAILTAAHCLDGAQEIVVLHDRGEQAAEGWIANPLFYQFGRDAAFDIGLIKVSGFGRNIGVSPASFNSERPLQAGDVVKLIGYGEDGSPTLPNNNPRGIEMTILGVDQGVIGISFDQNQGGACQGDSGGALTLDGEIVGTVSYGGLNCDTGNVVIYAWTQNRGNIEFLESQLPGVTQ